MERSEMFTQEFENYLFSLKYGNSSQVAKYNYLTYEELYQDFINKKE